MNIESTTVTDQTDEAPLAPQVQDEQSDAPIVDDPGKVEDAPQADSDSTAAPSDATTDPKPAAEPKPSGRDKRIDELTFRAKEAERQADHFRVQLEQAQSRLTPAEGESPLIEPKVEDFADYGDYIKAQGQFGADLRIREERQTTADAAGRNYQNARAEISKARGETFKARADVFKETHPDFDDVVIRSTSIKVTNEMRDVLMDMELGPEVAYHLGTHQAESQRIANLSPMQAAVALGRIEAALSSAAPPAKPGGAPAVSGAPDPIVPVTGSGSSEPKDSRRMSTTEWMEWRNKQVYPT